MKNEGEREKFKLELATYKLQEIVIGLPIVTETTPENFAK